MPVRIGVDLGGTKIEVVALNDRNETLIRRRVATPAGDYPGILTAIGDIVDGVEAELGFRAAVGVGTPGTASTESGLMKNANSTVLIGKPLRRDLEARLQRPVRMTNDANCFALSEAVDGAAAGAGVVFAVILGTGVGGGIAVDRRVLEGPNGIAGEWGHNPLPWPRADELPGPLCYCGKHGCIETFLAGPAVSREYRSVGGGDAPPTTIAYRAQEGEGIALACLRRYEDRLARGLGSIINVLDPDVIVLGGGVSNIERVYEHVPALLTHYVFSDTVRTKIVRAAHGDSSGVRGAAMLVG